MCDIISKLFNLHQSYFNISVLFSSFVRPVFLTFWLKTNSFTLALASLHFTLALSIYLTLAIKHNYDDGDEDDDDEDDDKDDHDHEHDDDDKDDNDDHDNDDEDDEDDKDFFLKIIINGLGYTPSQKIELWCVYKISTLYIFTYIKN